MVLIRHYFPGVDVNSLDDEEFAIIANDADWLHANQLQIQQANAIGLMTT
jgi:hypothetical protein